MLSGHLCRCTGYTPIVDAIAEVARSVNLALSLLYAAERTPDAEALVGESRRLTYAGLRQRAAQIAAGLATRGVAAATVSHACSRTSPRLSSSTGDASGSARRRSALAPASRRPTSTYCIDDAAPCSSFASRARCASSSRDAEHPGALDLDEREPSIQLYTSGTTGRPKGVPRSHRAERAGGLSQALQHGLRRGHRTLGVMPLYHTMGIHSLLAACARRGLLRGTAGVERRTRRSS